MFIQVDEMKTHIFEEDMELIEGSETTLITAAIDGAVAEAKSYLSGYDTNAIFSATGRARNALLLIFVKDMALWHYLNLANPGNELEFRRSRYNAAIEWLRSVRKGDNTPDLPKTTTTSPTSSGSVSYGFNPKRGNHY